MVVGRSASVPPWAHAERAPAFAALAHALPTLAAQNFHDPQWARWATSDRCETDWPSTLPPATTPFQKILLVQALRQCAAP